MLASFSEQTFNSPASEPGRSGRRTKMVSRRPSLVSLRRTRLGMRPMSMLPPESTMQVVPVVAGRSWRVSNVDKPTAPPPSTSILECSMRRTTASAIWSSSTSMMSSTHLSIIGLVIAPGCLTAMPSAKVSTCPSGEVP